MKKSRRGVKLLLTTCLCASLFYPNYAQGMTDLDVVKVSSSRKKIPKEKIDIPNIPGYETLKCDFHIHTIFSDGGVLPEKRVSEALQRDLDAIAITEHIEYRPYKGFVKGDHNASYKRAKNHAKNSDLIVIHGAEITRSKPLGHLNALFLTDANPLDKKDPLEALDEAVKQGAFILWNHPGWPDDSTKLHDIQKELIAKDKIHGIEIVNAHEYYPKAFNFCDDHDLAYISNTDIHGVYTEIYDSETDYAPMTLVFAKERNTEGIKDALMNQRSIAKFGNLLIGPKEYLIPLVEASLDVEVTKRTEKDVSLKVSNSSSIGFEIAIHNKIVEIPPHATMQFKVPRHADITVLNTFVRSDQQLEFNLDEII